MPTSDRDDMSQARRRFLASCGKFAAVTPPAITLLLSAAQSNYAVAFSGQSGGGGPKGNNGWGNGADPTNAGSFSGGTAPSKSTNSSDPSAGKTNTNPTTSN